MPDVTPNQVLDALRVVKDPDLHEDIVKLGFVKNIRICEGSVAFDIELTTPACPVKERLQTEARDAVKKISGVSRVDVTMTSQVSRSLPPSVADTLSKVKNIIAVSSGKGGVGKSTVAVNLALALANTGAKVGLMDADVYGPSVPKMLAGTEKPGGKDNKILPIERYGIRFMSMALLTDAETPVIWRGPMATKLVQQFLANVEWGELDYLLIDLPPGTGDVQLTLTQSAPLTGAVVVTTPQEVAVSVTMRGIRMFEEVQVPILGVIENMSGFVCPHCDKETDIFRSGGGERTAKELGLRFLGRVPIDPKLTLGGDSGRPVVLEEGPNRPISAIAFDEIARNVASQVSIVTRMTATIEMAPKKITNDDKVIIVEWVDGSEAKLPFRDLRLGCPCAGCVDEWTGEKRLVESAVPANVHPTNIRTVGRYGIQISWSDGHSTGIYTFNRIREFARAKPAVVPAAGGLQQNIIDVLKTIFDPEIPVNIYELGLIYGVDVKEAGNVNVRMTLTSPSCPAAEQLPPEVETKVRSVPGVQSVKLDLVWDPPWDKEMMSEAAKLQLGFL